MPGQPRTIVMDPPYDRLLDGILSFRDFSAAEGTLRQLENLRQRFMAASDKKGVEYCRRIALLGRRRSELVSRNKKIEPRNRAQKREISLWFRLWLESPEIFWDWLELRKQAAEFKCLSSAAED
jgi:hypothetical protein